MNMTRNLKLFGAVIALSAFSISIAQAQTMTEKFFCGAGDITYTVNISPMQPGVANVDVSVGEMMDQNLRRQFLLNRTNPMTGIAFSGIDARLGKVTFTAKDENSGKLSFGSETLSCDFDTPYYDTGNNRRNDNRLADGEVAVNVPGRSLGGNLRAGPDSSYNLIQFTPMGEPIRLINRTTVMNGGKPYFKVKSMGNVGYMKGKHICSEGRKIDGVVKRCTQYDVPYEDRRNTYSSNNNGDRYGGTGTGYSNQNRDDTGYSSRGNYSKNWMVFAVDEAGAVGHGVHQNRAKAKNIAMRYCGSCCSVVDESSAQCHALAHSKSGGYWYGIAAEPTRHKARKAAIKYCTEHAPTNTCRVAHAYCQGE